MTRTTQRLSLANVRTHTTRKIGPALRKHELYMKLTSLEIERSRRETERNATANRIVMIDQRIDAIRVEQEQILALLEQANKETTTQDRPSNTSKLAGKGINLKY